MTTPMIQTGKLRPKPKTTSKNKPVSASPRKMLFIRFLNPPHRLMSNPPATAPMAFAEVTMPSISLLWFVRSRMNGENNEMEMPMIKFNTTKKMSRPKSPRRAKMYVKPYNASFNIPPLPA